MSKQLEHYILNPFIEIKGYKELKGRLNENKNELAAPIIKKIKKGKRFLLSSRIKEVLINDTIKTFLSYFVTSNTLSNVSHSFAKAHNTSSEKVLPTLERFLDDMLYQGIIVPLSKQEELLQIKKENEQVERQLAYPIGSIVKNYQVKEIISEKPKFDIYLANHLPKQQPVILKTLYLSKKLSKEKRKDRKAVLKQEFQLLKEVSGHQNICQFIDYFKYKGQAVGVMEYINGWTLKKYLQNQQPDLQQKSIIIQQLFDAVAHVHSCGILHGDIHNSNFLINKQHIVKLFDFDLANHEQLQKKEVQRVGGVFKYFPPERIRKNTFDYIKDKATYRSEVYQVAVVAYYVLYERLPFKALTWRKLAKIIKKEPPIFTVHTPKQETIPATFIKVLQKALSKKPKDRYKSAISLSKKWRKVTSN